MDDRVFDPVEAHARLAAVLEDSAGEVSCSLWKSQSSGGSRSWSLSVQVGRGKHGCRGAIRVDEAPQYDESGRFVRHGVRVRGSTGYPLRLEDPDIRRSLAAVWAECERQGAIPVPDEATAARVAAGQERSHAARKDG